MEIGISTLPDLVNKKIVLYGTAIMQIPSIFPQCSSRREARRQSRRDAIIDVAGHSFLERGYAATTMSAIAAELGGSKGTLWSYFPDKERLFEAVIDRATEAFQQQLVLILNPKDDPEITLCLFARNLLGRVTLPKSLALFRLVVSEAHRFPETGRIFHQRAMGRTQRQVAAYLGDVTARGALKVNDLLLASTQLIALLLAGSHQKLILRLIEEPDPASLEDDAMAAVATFMRAYGA